MVASGRLALLLAAALLATALTGCIGDDEAGPGSADVPDGSSGEDGDSEPIEMYVVATDHSLGAGTQWELHPDAFEVEAGDTVEVTLKSADGNSFEHSLVIEGFDLRISPIQEGETANATFVATETGSFAYFCDVGNHRELGMEGTLTVSEASNGTQNG